MDILSNLFVVFFGYVFLVYGWEFTDTAWFRISELAELPLWTIHIAWPVAGATWILFAGERIWDDLQVLLHGEKGTG
jgi:TRAP-type C4-dicarboxylate transport system permease small subunit